MKKKAPKIITISIALAIMAFLITSIILNAITFYNDETVIGNTAGNLYNGGLYCEYGDIIYFSNFQDDGALYRMDAKTCGNIKKISEDKVCYINADKHYLYYSRINYKRDTSTVSIFRLFNSGIYRISRTGSTKLVQLYGNPSGLIQLYGNHIYYQHHTNEEGLSFYRVKINAKEEQMLSQEALLPACFYEDRLYYSGVLTDHYIHSMDPVTLSKETVYDGSTYLPIARPEGIYFISLNDYSLRRYEPDTDTVTTLVSEPCFTYNISNDGRYLYYQIDQTDNNRIEVMDLSTGIAQTIQLGNFKQIHVTSNYVFFTDFNDVFTYAYTTDGSGVLSTFHPTVE